MHLYTFLKHASFFLSLLLLPIFGKSICIPDSAQYQEGASTYPRKERHGGRASPLSRSMTLANSVNLKVKVASMP